MENTAKYGLVGKNISYSFSQKYFTEKFQKLFLANHFYHLFDLKDISEIFKILKIDNLKGFNVTIPYKEQIIPFLDQLSGEAEKIGAVNTVKITSSHTIGYNTDTYGFEKTLKLYLEPHHRQALILGDGGAAKAVKYVLDQMNIPYKTVSRKSDLNFENLTGEQVSQSQIIIQCTPVGTYPKCDDCLAFPFESIDKQHLIIDLIYNPSRTKFMQKASDMGAKCANGFFMLEQQAEKAWQIWNM